MAASRGGRPSKLTPAVQDRICECLAGGCTRVDAATQGGINYMTLRRWERQGERQKSGKYRRFCEALKKAESDAAEFCVAAIKRAATERDEVTVKRTEYPDGTVKAETTTRTVFEWTPAAWWLERMRATDFGKKESAEVAGMRTEMAALRALVSSLPKAKT